MRLSIVARVALAFALILSAVAKLVSPASPAAVSDALGLSSSGGGALLVAMAILEGVLGVLLLAGVWRTLVHGVIVSLLLLFTGVLLHLHAEGLGSGGCGCFGSFLPVELYVHMLINGSLLGLGVLSWPAERDGSDVRGSPRAEPSP